jgi:putative tryptophan/tyrosine transport system substrate-binding protein
MRRREFITLVGGAVAVASLPARAQQPERLRRIAMLVGSANNAEGQSRVIAFRQALEAHGWVEGRNVQIDLRWDAANIDLAQSFAKEIVGLAPDVILAETTPVVAAVLSISRKIPLVFVNVSDPVGSRFVDSLARPGEFVTGFISNEACWPASG